MTEIPRNSCYTILS